MARPKGSRNRFPLRRPVRIDGDLAYVPLADGREAIVDAADAEAVAAHVWNCPRGGYPQMNTDDGPVRLHVFLIGRAPEGMHTDHINRDRLDNRRANLRFVTPGENARNKPGRGPLGYVGVWAARGGRRWAAVLDRRRIGTFATPEEAAVAYDAAVLAKYGAHSVVPLNHRERRAA